MLKIKKVKKLLAFIMIALIIFSSAQPIFAISGNGSGTWIGGQYASKITTTDYEAGSDGIIIRRLVNQSTQESITAFCAEHGVEFETGVGFSSSYAVPTDQKIKEACKVAYFGWYKDNPTYAVDGGILTEGFYAVKLKLFIMKDKL